MLDCTRLSMDAILAMLCYAVFHYAMLISKRSVV